MKFYISVRKRYILITLYVHPVSFIQDYNLDTLAKRFGLTPEQFGENLRDNYVRNEVEQYPADPVELGKECVDERGSFNTWVAWGKRKHDKIDQWALSMNLKMNIAGKSIYSVNFSSAIDVTEAVKVEQA